MELWSWVLTTVGITGLYFAGKKKAVGWAIGFGSQTLWIAYALHTDQLGFLFSALAYGSVYARNWILWWEEGREVDENVDSKNL